MAPSIILPISSSQTTQETNNPPIANLASGSFVSQLSNSAGFALSHCRPWLELLDFSAIAHPSSLSEATSRLSKNIPYFRINYLLLLSSILALSHPISLFLSFAWLFLYVLRSSDAPPLHLLGRSFSDNEILIGLISLTTFIVFLTSVGSIIITALMIGIAIVALHGSYHVPYDLFLPTEDPSISNVPGPF
ncbi:PRA1 family protein B2-like [Magnolia sinica]|uniref:PRA1 family protein B2-like n=1 Tax=Magnolia sinica TaxID=86752 RepID=UPI002658BE6B|nr:PRA1 family protein B2-like [Magnolia sinica]